METRSGYGWVAASVKTLEKFLANSFQQQQVISVDQNTRAVVQTLILNTQRVSSAYYKTLQNTYHLSYIIIRKTG
jgi:hypothetical protein